MTILPRIKKCETKQGFFIFNRVDFEYIVELKFASNLLQIFCEDYSISFNKAKNPNFLFKKISSDIKEFYKLNITDSYVEIQYSDMLSARNAVASFLASTVEKDGQLVCECFYAEDYPDNSYRGFMIDLARKYLEIDEFKRQIKLMANFKYNKLHLHLLDTEHYALDSKAVPELSKNPIFLTYSSEELKEIGIFANSIGLEIIPELDFPGHGLMVLTNMPELACVNPDSYQSVWASCISNEKLYEVIEKLFIELKEIFAFDYMHIGGDELSFYDLVDAKFWPSWFDCESCKKLNFENHTEKYFYYFIDKIYKIAKKLDKKLILFNDPIDLSKPVPLSRDIILQFWRIAGEGRGPHIGCSLERLLEEGFKVINSYYPETYCDTLIQTQNLVKWNTTNSPVFDSKYKEQVIGGEMCAWGRMSHYNWTLPSSLIIMADRLWNNKGLEDNVETERAMQRQLFSKTEIKSNIYSLLGGKILPLDGQKFFKQEVSPTAQQVIDAVKEMTSIERGQYSQSVNISRLKDCLINLMNTLIY